MSMQPSGVIGQGCRLGRSATPRWRSKCESYIPYDEARIDFLLKAGVNWTGPIKDFRLVVNKGAADNLVSFCRDGVRKISPTEFKMRRTDFIPSEDLHVLILEKTDE
jgi:hypothetical protein